MQSYFKLLLLSILFISFCGPRVNAQGLVPTCPDSLRGRIDMEREGTHDFNNIRTVFKNYGMVGDYPADPLKVDLSVFHSVEIPKGSGENYSDGITPFVLAKINQENGQPAYIMETGFRERQIESPRTGKIMRFEPRPGYFQTDPLINKARSIAMSNDSRTWPDEWINKLSDTNDRGWKGQWNGYFGKAPKDEMQESYTVYDDNFYDAWNFYPDNRDRTRRGLGLRVEQRGFQWNNPQAGNVIFFHYEITNESTTDYNDNIVFGLYMDAGVGGSTKAMDPYPESDDDNAYFLRKQGLNMVYTWDYYGHGAKGNTGYLGYSYLETPGSPDDGKDNDDDGITDEKRGDDAGQLIIGQDKIRQYVYAHYDMAKFTSFYGPLEDRPAFKTGYWWTGDEDMDWQAEYDDTGADGVFGSGDTGEKDGKPTQGEPNFGKTDIDESDQIGLTGFKYNVINDPAGGGRTDNIVFFNNDAKWPERLFNRFSTPDSAFDAKLTATNINIGFLFASGPFKLKAGQTERFSLALAFGQDLYELENNVKIVQKIYKANYQFSVPPPMPTVKATAGDHFVTLTWNDVSERAYDPVTNVNDFEGYRIYRSTDPAFLDPKVIYTGNGSGPLAGSNGRFLAEFDLKNGVKGYSKTTVDGVGYFLGTDNGLSHTFTDTTCVNGQKYYYAVTAYDHGSDSLELYPSENAISVTQTLRGGIVPGKNVAIVTPNPRVLGYEPAAVNGISRESGSGFGSVKVEVKNPEIVPDNHLFKIAFKNYADSVKAYSYSLIDVTDNDTLFVTGTDFNSKGIGPVGKGLLPLISTIDTIQIDTVKSGFTSSSSANFLMKPRYAPTKPMNLRRTGYPGYPGILEIQFSNTAQDTTIAGMGIYMKSKEVNFKVVVKEPEGDRKLKFRFYDSDNSGTLNRDGEYLEIMTTMADAPTTYLSTWNIKVDTTGQSGRGTLLPPAPGDVYRMVLNLPLSDKDSYTFTTRGQRIDKSGISSSGQKPYVVPNPYVGAASFEPQRFAVSGRGERKIEFRNLPPDCKIRIYTVTGELVKTLTQSGIITEGYVAWDLRSKDNLEIAPGLYIYQVEAENFPPFIGKFAVIK